MRAQMGLGSSPSYNPLSIRADRPSGAAGDGAADASAVVEKHLELIEAAELLEAALEASTKREAEPAEARARVRRAPPRGGYGARGGGAPMRRSSARRRTRTRRPRRRALRQV